jgi:uncharacterized protein YdcH (DUF465 family)
MPLPALDSNSPGDRPLGLSWRVFMERQELELISSLSQTNPELKHLWGQHTQYEAQLAALERVHHPSEGERREINRLKRLKLRGKERISRIIEGQPAKA